jgi:hypothetical protein
VRRRGRPGANAGPEQILLVLEDAVNPLAIRMSLPNHTTHTLKQALYTMGRLASTRPAEPAARRIVGDALLVSQLGVGAGAWGAHVQSLKSRYGFDEAALSWLLFAAAAGVVCALFAGFIPLGKLAELVNIGTLFAFVMVCLGVVVLRITQPNLPRPFKTPWSPLVPLLGAASCGALMTFLPLDTWVRFAGWLAMGVAFYFLYSMKHSALALESP